MKYTSPHIKSKHTFKLMETNIEEVNKGVFRLSGTGKEIQMTLADIQNLSISTNKYDFDNDDMLIHNFRGKCI